MGRVWRRIAVPHDEYFETLSYYILKAFDFDRDHLYMFIYKNRHGVLKKIYDERMDESPHGDELEISEIGLQPGQSVDFRYDFGDNWLFNVLLEDINDTGSNTKPGILESHGEVPEQYPVYDI